MKSSLSLFVLALGVLLVGTQTAFAAGSANVSLVGDYMDELAGYWKKFFQQQNGVVIGALVLGAVALLIIISAGRKVKR